MWIRPRSKLRLKRQIGLPVIEPRNPLFPSLQPPQHIRQIAIRRRPRHQRHIRSLVEDLLALLLRHTPQHGELLPLTLQPLVLVQPVKHLLLGLVANRTGVVQNQPRLAFVLNAGIPLLLQRPNHLLGVMGVHLAAKGFDIESLAHGYSIDVANPQLIGL